MFNANSESWHISLESATAAARTAADKSWLPQTVYRTTETCGWANVCFGSNILQKKETEQAVTVLPSRFFE